MFEERIKPLKYSLNEAVYEGNLEKVSRLINSGSCLAPTHRVIQESETHWGNYGDPINDIFPDKDPPLYWGIKSGNVQVVQILLEAHNQQGLPIVDTCLELAAKEGSFQVIELLIREGGAPADTLFLKALRCNRVMILKELIGNGVDPNQRDEEGNTFLHLLNSSLSSNDVYPLDAVTYVCKKIKSEDMGNAAGNTPLHTSLPLGLSTLNKLVRIPSLNKILLKKNNEGETILHKACNGLADNFYFCEAKIIVSASSSEQLQKIQNEVLNILNRVKDGLKEYLSKSYSSPYYDPISGIPGGTEMLNTINCCDLLVHEIQKQATALNSMSHQQFPLAILS